MNPQGGRVAQSQVQPLRPDIAAQFLRRASDFSAGGPHVGVELFKDVSPENFQETMKQIEKKSKEMAEINAELRSSELRPSVLVDSFISQIGRIPNLSSKLNDYETQEMKFSHIRKMGTLARNLSTADELRNASKRQCIRKEGKTITLSIPESKSSKFDDYIDEVNAKKDMVAEVTKRRATSALVKFTLPFILEATIFFDLSSEFIGVDFIRFAPLSKAKSTNSPFFSCLNDNAIQHISSVSKHAAKGIFHCVLVFIESHRSLFSANCVYCKKILRASAHSKAPMPPTLRSFGQTDRPSHLECAPRDEVQDKSITDFIITYKE